MSDLPKCLLCQGKPFKMLAHGTVIHPTDKSRPCALNGIEVTPEQWTALMGRGEPVGYMFRRSICSDHDPADCEEYDDFVSRADVGLEELAEHEKHGMVMEVYAQAPAVDGAVLRDAAAYRWLIDSPRNGPVWNNVLTEEQRAGHCDVDAAIKAAIKGEG